ncbi:MAG: helix-turn-helix domain-containing protein, partial [Actinobacteria bacterium]|nr:helix-turn-helix domain-containing protein [Actinomycetota bacterium]
PGGHEVPGAGEACRAIGEARQARRLAALGLGDGGARMVDGAQLGSRDLLLALAPEEARASFAQRALGPLLAYDREHGGALLSTLEVFLACSGSWTRAAGKLFIHVNSLRYRIRRIEELTGRNLSSLTDQADLLIALQLNARPPH